MSLRLQLILIVKYIHPAGHGYFYCVNTSYPMDKCYSGRRDRLAKRQKKTSCVSTGQPLLVLVHSPDGVSNPFPA